MNEVRTNLDAYPWHSRLQCQQMPVEGVARQKKYTQLQTDAEEKRIFNKKL